VSGAGRPHGDAFLGINILHDTSAALVVDGELMAAVEEERFNRERHTGAFPARAVEYCLAVAGLEPSQLTAVGTTFDYCKFRFNAQPFEQHTIAHHDRGLRGRVRILADSAAVWRQAKRELASSGLRRPRFVRHHLTHAACGYYLSGYPRAGVLVFDGRGERESTSLWRAEGTRIQHLESYGVKDSLGHLYTYVTYLCGLYGTLGNEGKTMGLAGYGSGQMTLDDVLLFEGDRYRVDRRRMRELAQYQAPRGRPDDRSRELAYAVQAKLEEAYRFLARRLVALSGCDSVVLSGGIALNCNANGMLAGSGLAKELFVPPAANDAGTAIGAAYLMWAEHTGRRPAAPRDMVYLGPSFNEAAIRDAIGWATMEASHSVRRVDDPADVAAAAIASGYVVGWYQGGMEFGPRALGNRSILADPRDPEMPKKLNNRVKYREPWRPFAPSVLADEAAGWFSPAVASPHMLLSFTVRPERRGLVPAITHVDGSSRIQTVTAQSNPIYHALIKRFHDLTGVPMVLNTSLNIKGQPIARTPADAIRCFLHSGLDVLVMGNWVLAKEIESERMRSLLGQASSPSG
jgi:carbamoyltransferase